MIFNKSSKIIAAVLTAALALSPVFVTPISATDGQEVETDASSWRYQDGDIIEEGNVILPEDADESIVEDYNSQMGSSFEEQTEEPAAEPAALQMPAEAVQRMSAAQQIPAEAEQAEPAKAAPETPAVPQEESAEEERRREDDDSRMSPEEVVRKNSAEKGRYSQVSLDDLFGE